MYELPYYQMAMVPSYTCRDREERSRRCLEVKSPCGFGVVKGISMGVRHYFHEKFQKIL